MAEARLVLSTVDSQKAATALATSLVEDRLAACVTVVPGVQSIYRWQGVVETAAEWLLLIKTTTAGVPSLLKALADRHPYEVPEGLVVDVENGLPDYLAWLSDSIEAVTGTGHE